MANKTEITDAIAGIKYATDDIDYCQKTGNRRFEIAQWRLLEIWADKLDRAMAAAGK